MIYIKKLEASNFRSFQKLSVNLAQFNVLIGPNAAGKSNFVELLMFLKDLASNPKTKTAVAKQGGIPFLRNINAHDDKITIRAVLEISGVQKALFKKTKAKARYVPSQLDYRLTLNLKPSKSNVGDYEISREVVRVAFSIQEFKKHARRYSESGSGTVTIARYRGEKVKKTFDIRLEEWSHYRTDKKVLEDEILPIYFESLLKSFGMDSKTTLLSRTFALTPAIPYEVSRFFSDITTYDFNPKRIKRPAEIGTEGELHREADNLALILDDILNNESRKREFLSLFRDLLPFVKDIQVDTSVDKSALIKLREIYNRQSLPASLLSDGTANIAALVIALFFEEKSLIVIEEPERNIHPSLAARVVQSVIQASKLKQIILTTHSPEIVRWSPLDNVLFIRRDRDGSSEVGELKGSRIAAEFLKNEVGLGEIFIEGHF